MSAVGRLAAVAVLSLSVLAGLASVAGASPPPPANLTVVGGEDAWRAGNRFTLKWENQSGSGPAIVAVRYLVRNPGGGLAIGKTRLGWSAERLDLTVPKAPGAYSAEVWLEDAAGSEGAAASAKLRFDDVRPGPIAPPAAPRWIGRTAFPLTLRLGRPLDPVPVSGIRGYAVSIDREPGGLPCAVVDRCSESETTLRGGVAGDSLEIAALAEGVSFLSAVAVSGSGMKSATAGGAILRVDTTDPQTRLSGAPATWANRPVSLTATATDAGSGMAVEGSDSPPFTALRIGSAPPTIGLGASVTATVIEEGTHTVSYYARDAAGNANDGGHGNGLFNRPPATAVVRIDRSAPHAAFAAPDPRDPELIRVRIFDSLSGPDPSRGWIAIRPAGSNERFSALPAAEPVAGEIRARWDSQAYRAGDYEFQAMVYDAAGNSAAVGRRANGAAMVLSSPLKAATTLRTAFGGRAMSRRRCVRRDGRRRCRHQRIAAFERRRGSRTVSYGRSVIFSGQLIAGRTVPLAGMPIRVVERIPGAPPRLTTVRTEPGGAFRLRLAPGPSREVVALFDGTRTLSRSTGRPLRLAVRSGVRLRASSQSAKIGGAPLIFRGRVAAHAGAAAAEGKAVQLQFRLPGLPWAEFRTVKTSRSGRFRYAYRFSDDDSSGVAFQFRAYAPTQSDWPYEPGGSRPVTVRGR